MARIRSVKPDFPHVEALGRCSRDSRLAFILLMTVADDEGRFRAHPALLACTLFPYDNDRDDAVAAAMDQLADQGVVVVYSLDGEWYGEIQHWHEYQRIDRPTPSKLPPPPKPSAASAITKMLDAEGVYDRREDSRALDEPSTSPREDSRRKGMEGNGEEKEVDAAPRQRNKAFSPPTLGEVHDYMATRITNPLRAASEAARFHAYHESRGWVVGKLAMKDWKAAVRYWVTNVKGVDGIAGGVTGPVVRLPS